MFFGRAVAWRGRLCIVIAAIASLVATEPAPALAQSGADRDTAANVGADTVPAADRGPRSVSGRIVRPTKDDVVPVPGIWVTLHRVGSDTARPIDSVRTKRDGSYAFQYHLTGRADAVYFASASYDGVAYFSLPFRKPRVSGPDAEVTVYDTTSGPLTLHVRGRHMIVSAPHVDGTRDVFEVYDLSNDSSVTLVSPDDAHPTWSTIIPAQASQFEVGQSEVSPRAIHQEVGRVEIVAPFAPGLKQISFGYRLPEKAFPLSVPLEREATVLEVLLEEPSASVHGARIAPVGPVLIEGRRFQRFLGQDAPANSVFTVDMPAVATSYTDTRIFAGVAIAIGAVMLAALALAFQKRRRPLVVAPAPHAPHLENDAAHLARVIADLDAEFEGRPNPSAEERAAYQARRAELKRDLAHALDAERQLT